MVESLRTVKRQWAVDDAADGADRMKWLGGVAAIIALFVGWNGGPEAAMRSGTLGLLLLFALIFGFIPWYQARKRLRVLGTWDAATMSGRIPEIRFETWLARQPARFTWALIALMGAAGLIQLLPGETWPAAGLVKSRYAAGEWWRILTAPWLHGHPVHWFMNAGALLYLGRRVEVMARWPHLLMVFFMAAVAGGLASIHGNPEQPTIGASGAILGLLGFLLVFETLHRRLVPVPARRRLLAGVALTAVIGALAFRFIDNWAHAGGLVAGLIYAAVVFPSSTSPHRPRATVADLILGALCGLILAASAAWAIRQMAGL